MSYTFILTAKPTTLFLKYLNTLVAESNPISSQTAYNMLMKHIIMLAKKYSLPKIQGSLFPQEIIEAQRPYPLSEPTPWGGVALKQVDVTQNYIRKLLVINQYGLLGFELHKQKLEKLKILEGTCLLISSQHKAKNKKKDIASIELAKAGDKTIFYPGDEHGIVALTNCVIEEQSTNDLTDLNYVLEASQVL